MKQSFVTTALAGDRVLVTGADDSGGQHRTILDAKEWNELQRQNLARDAAEEFDAAVEEFFAPLTEAADRAQTALQQHKDPAFYVVLQEAEEGTPAKAERLHFLARDTVILRMIDSGDTSRLIWIDDSIEILEQKAAPTDVDEPTDESDDSEG